MMESLTLEEFLIIYPEFQKFTEDPKAEQIFEIQVKEVLCLFPVLREVSECSKFPTYSLLAHYMIINNRFTSLGFNAPDGIVTSSSVGSVSVSFESKIFSNQFEYFLSQTPYGLKFLSWWNSKTGVRYVNN